ncbi:hypothetical protein IJ818_04420 [bacterium]|nr:hypothetical protein [bacterium]
MARTIKIFIIAFVFLVFSAEVKSAEVIKAEPIFTTTTPIIKPHIVEPPSKPVQTTTPDINYVPKINQNTNVPVVKNAELNITTSPAQSVNTVNKVNTNNTGTVNLNTSSMQSNSVKNVTTQQSTAKPSQSVAVSQQTSAQKPVVQQAVSVQSSNTNFVKPVSNQSAVQNPAVIPQVISFQKCTKIFPVESEKLFYLSLASINANKFTINEIQSKSGYILFSVMQKQFLLSIATVDKKNSIAKITPANNNYYFPEGIVTNIFKYIDLNTDTEVSKI